jgi:hypothetical protein
MEEESAALSPRLIRLLRFTVRSEYGVPSLLAPTLPVPLPLLSPPLLLSSPLAFLSRAPPRLDSQHLR